MGTDRWQVAGIASPHSKWFFDLARWSNAAAVPVDFVKCISVFELLSRFSIGETYSAVLIDADVGDLDRAFVSKANDYGTEVILVGEISRQEWTSLGAVAQLAANFKREDLITSLQMHIRSSDTAQDIENNVGFMPSVGWQGHLVAVTGGGGSGASLLAMALAQGFAREASNRGLVLLADLALNADQAIMHDTRDLIHGLQELVESCYSGWLGHSRLRHLFCEPEGRGYHLLSGLRRHLDWTTLKQRPLEAALNGLIRTYRFVIADTEVDLEGRSDTGSSGIEDRNRLARTVIRRSDLIVVVGASDMLSMHSLVRTILYLVDKGIDCDRLLPVINKTVKNPRVRSSLKSALAQTLANTEAQHIAEPVFVPMHRGVESALRDGVALPAILVKQLHKSVIEQLKKRWSVTEQLKERAMP